jgi:hypothetical protein
VQQMLLGARPMGGNAMPDFPSGGLDLIQHLNLDGIMLDNKVGCAQGTHEHSFNVNAESSVCLSTQPVRQQRTTEIDAVSWCTVYTCVGVCLLHSHCTVPLVRLYQPSVDPISHCTVPLVQPCSTTFHWRLCTCWTGHHNT